MKKMILFFCFFVSVVLPIHPATACTDFRLIAKDGTVVVARSMEFATNMQANIRTQQRGVLFNTMTSEGKPALSWKTKYGYLYLDGLNIDKVVDGMNEKGLAFEALYLPGEAEYQSAPAKKFKEVLPYMSLGDWVLGNFQSVDEVRSALTHIYLVNEKLPGVGDTIFPLHYAITDASGKSIIVEYIKGQMKIYDNAVGILTNSPTYDWHLTHLKNFLNLSPYSPQPIFVGTMEFAATGQGAGSVGLPGDTSPSSRFVKIAFLKNNALLAADAAEVINLAQHLINNVDIPLGAVRAKQQSGPDMMDYTQWVVVKDLTHKMFYFRSYEDLTLRGIELGKINFSENAGRLKMPVSVKRDFADETAMFLQQKM